MIKRILAVLAFCSVLNASSSNLVTVVCGPMFSGKTQQLMDDVEKFEESGGIPITISYYGNSRDGLGLIKSRSYPDRFLSSSCSFGQIEHPFLNQLRKKVNDIEVYDDMLYSKSEVFIDEFQFMTPIELNDLQQFVESKQIKVTLYGLNLNFKREPFSAFTHAVNIFDPQVVFKHARCAICCRFNADFTARFHECKFCKDGVEQIIEGAIPAYSYAPVCEDCWGKDLR